jgi:hypothetical protein
MESVGPRGDDQRRSEGSKRAAEQTDDDSSDDRGHRGEDHHDTEANFAYREERRVFDAEHGHGWSAEIVRVETNSHERGQADDDPPKSDHAADNLGRTPRHRVDDSVETNDCFRVVSMAAVQHRVPPRWWVSGVPAKRPIRAPEREDVNVTAASFIGGLTGIERLLKPRYPNQL